MLVQKEIYDKKRALECVSLMKKYYLNQNEEELANVEIPSTLEIGSEAWLYYIFYSCLLDYGMKSKIYHKNLIATFYKFPDLFYPAYVVNAFQNSKDELFHMIKNNIHPRYPNIALKKWFHLSIELAKYPNLLEKFQSFNSYEEVEKFIKSTKSYGQKTGGLLLRLIFESNICKFKDTISFIPLDRHDIEISYLNGVISSTKLTNKELDMLSSLWIESGKELGIKPNVVDKYLWQIGNSFCSKKDCLKCPLGEICQKKE